MDEEKNEILIQITCKFSIDNQRNGFVSDVKHENFNNQLIFNEEESSDKIFHDTVEDLNLAKLYLDGFDVTIVKYGRKNVFYETEEESEKTDKSTSSSEDSDDSENDTEANSGIVQKFIRTIFEELVSAKDLNFIFSIGWTEINEQNQLLDLLNGNGLIQCFSMQQLMEALSVGLSNRNSSNNHNILSVVLEQQWINPANGQPQHKLSTVNFCDLNYGTDRAVLQNYISEPRDLPMNFYSQPAPPLPPYAYMMPSVNGNYFSPPPAPPEFGFFNTAPPRINFEPSAVLAQQQNCKLLKNAEILFSKLNLNGMDDSQRKEIQEWMYLKNECDNYMPPPVMAAELPPSYFGNMNMLMNQPPPQMQPPPPAPQQPSSLLPIIEMDETNDPDEDETNDNESECGSYIDINDQSNNLFKKISDKMTSFREKTDELVRNKSSDYFDNNPKVLSSGQSDVKPVELLDEAAGAIDLKVSTNTSISEQQYLAKPGRRRSIRDNNLLNSEELTLIRKAAAATSLDHEIVKDNVENEQMTKLDDLRKTLKKSLASIDATNLQIKEVEQTIALKKNLITDLIENSKTRMTAKSNCSKKKTKYQNEYEKTKKDLSRAILGGKSQKEIQRLKDMMTKFEEKLLDLTGINEIATESSSNKKVKQLHKSLEQSKRQFDVLAKVLKKEIKHKESIEKDIAKQLKVIEGENEDSKKLIAASPSPSSAAGSKISDSKVKIRDVNARISHLDEILKEKSSNLQLFGVPGSPGDDRDVKEKESLRYEIRNLRRTRDTLLDQRVSLYKKLKRDKMLTYKEERKMLECDEAIMAIDDVIEVKNELICGHKSIDTDDRLEREKGEALLMARLNKLSEEEMRILLYKYFMKVIDLKESCRKLEQNLMSLERDKEAWEWREKILTNAIRQARLESERNLVIQQKNHETRMNLLLRHFANETANSSLNESNFDTTSTSGAAALPDYEELNIVKATKSRHQYHQHQQHAQLHRQTEIDRDFKKNLFTKFHVFTRYHQQGASSSSVLADKEAIRLIPQENLKQLKEKTPATKVTRQKNKLIIQQNDKK